VSISFLLRATFTNRLCSNDASKRTKNKKDGLQKKRPVAELGLTSSYSQVIWQYARETVLIMYFLGE